MIESAEVILWGRRIGSVIRREGVPFAEFEYAPDFVGCGVEPSPIEMPVATGVYKFPSLPNASFHGLPGLLSDSVPDKFGNAVIDVWLEAQGRLPGSLSPIERLCYTRRVVGDVRAEQELFRRMVFNVLAWNCDDHVKNISYLMDKSGTWSLAPAYDECYAYNPQGAWTSGHQMSVNGKRTDIGLKDFLAAGKPAGLGEGICRKIIDEVRETVLNWLRFADEAGVREDQAASIDRLIKGIVEF